MTEPASPQRTPTGERVVVAALVLAALAAAAAAVTSWRGANTQIQGTCYAVAFGSFGVALIVWANVLTGGADHIQERKPLTAAPEESAEVDAELERDGGLRRRTLIRRTLWVAGGALGASFVPPLGSLGPSPGKRLLHTSWADGIALATVDGTPVNIADVPLDGLVTAFPQSDLVSADGQVVLVRVDPVLLRLPSGRQGWAPEGLVAYSKVCTHAGCPVGLYQSATHRLLCPCHQSSFDVLDGATPRSGPAAWPLPQLPLQIDAAGVIRAAGDFSEPVGPGWWKA
jgi:ubiquinol-cytochrome c reductase iron-sulfur subunit